MSDRNNYTIGWICAIEAEYLAAQLCLDKTHPHLECRPSPNDTNTYALGEINHHNVVIACLPSGSYGTFYATNVATNMLRSFPNVRISLLVGVGGGAPTRDSDIRLGDVVVSAPGDGKGGVFQHGFGKKIQEQDFQETGFLNRPPTVLLTGMMSLKVDYRRKPGSLEKAIDQIIEQQEEELRKELGRPEASTDILYRSDFVHPANSKIPCVEACGTDPTCSVVSRPERKRPRSPVVHYGLVASGNQLIKDALYRDELAEKWKVLCFKMEAAGLMNDFPCLVICGICNYADSHKNKEWQRYAAVAAAAYAKDLICKILPDRGEAEKKLDKEMSDLVHVSRQMITGIRQGTAQQQLEIQENAVKQNMSDKQKR